MEWQIQSSSHSSTTIMVTTSTTTISSSPFCLLTCSSFSLRTNLDCQFLLRLSALSLAQLSPFLDYPCFSYLAVFSPSHLPSATTSPLQVPSFFPIVIPAALQRPFLLLIANLLNSLQNFLIPPKRRPQQRKSERSKIVQCQREIWAQFLQICAD